MLETEELTNRQFKLLNLIIQLYLTGIQEISSLYLKSLGTCKISSATIRNELNILTQKGYLTKSHFASGRKPTLKSFILFIRNIYKSKTRQLATQIQVPNTYKLKRNFHQFLIGYIKKLSNLYNIFTFVTYENKVNYFGLSGLLDITSKLYTETTKSSYYKFYNLISLFDDPVTLRRFLIKSKNNLFFNDFSIQFIHLATNNSPHIVLGFINYKNTHPDFIGFIMPLNLNIIKVLQDVIYIRQILVFSKNTI